MTDEYKSGIVLYNPVGCIWLVMRGGAVGGQTERQDMWWQAAEVQQMHFFNISITSRHLEEDNGWMPKMYFKVGPEL